MKTNNRGFTLTELLVCTVIFGVVLIAAFGFMTASAKSYNKVNDRIEIQNESQAALNLLEEYVIDCAGGICFAGSTYTNDGTPYKCGTLYILGAPSAVSGVTTYNVDIFRLDTASGELQYANTTATQGVIAEDGTVPITVTAPAKYYKVTGKVVGFNVVTPDFSAEDVKYSVVITIGMENRSATYEGTMNITMRNTTPQISVS